MSLIIPQDFITTCRDMEQWSLDTELFANIGYNCLEMVKFFVEDYRLDKHANVNAENGRAFYLTRSKDILHYLIVQTRLQMTEQMYQDIIENKVMFPELSLELFNKKQLFNKMNDKYKPKENNNVIKNLKI